MYIRIFMRFDRYGNKEVIHIGPYGFSCYINEEPVRTGLVEDMESDIQSLLDEGFEELYI